MVSTVVVEAEEPAKNIEAKPDSANLKKRQGRSESPGVTARVVNNADGKAKSDLCDNKAATKGTSSVGPLFMPSCICMLLAANMIQSFSAQRRDLKVRFGWDEPTVGMVWNITNFGLCVVVHIGQLYDRKGGRFTAVVAIVLKVVGMLGMATLFHFAIDMPVLYGLFGLLDGQGTGALIIVGQTEAMLRCSNAATALGAAKTALGFAPGVWSFVYTHYLSPRVDAMYIANVFLTSSILAGFLFQFPGGPPPPMRATDSGDKGSKTDVEPQTLKSVVLSLDCLAIGGFNSIVVWGSGLYWISNISTFATSAGIQDQTSNITSVFFIGSASMRFVVGPILDRLKGTIPLEICTAISAGGLVLASAMMHFSEGRTLWLSAAIAGGGFGASATMDPLMCRTVSVAHQATLYAIGKVAGMLASMLWVNQLAAEVKKHTPSGAIDCVGHDCVRGTWLSIVIITIPLLLCTCTWALRRASLHKEKKA